MKTKILASMIAMVLAVSAIGCGNTPAEPTVSESPEIVEDVQATVSSAETVSEKEEPAQPKNTSKDMVERLSDEALTNTISDELKAKADAMPHASYDKLPDWNGTTLINKQDIGWTPEGVSSTYTEELVKEVAGEGFNFVRVTLDTRRFYEELWGKGGMSFDGNSDMVNMQQLKNVDDLISWCIDNGIHVCFDVHNTPGGYMTGADEEKSRKLLFTEGSKEEQYFFDFWEFFSQRYADISPNAVSFNLYNEPPAFLGEEQYVRFIKKAITYARPANPDRIIFVDMLEYASVPVYGLEDEDIVQAFHLYRPDQFTHSGYQDNFRFITGDSNRRSDKRVIVSYPIPSIYSGIQKGYQVNGDFKAGTKLTMGFCAGAVGAECVLFDDQGKELWSLKFDEDYLKTKNKKVLDGNMFSIYEEGGDKPVYEHFTLESDTSELSFKLRNRDHWLELEELVIETDTYKTLLAAQWIEGVGDDLAGTKAVVDEFGVVSVTDPAASKYDLGQSFIKEIIGEYVDFSKETGTPIMLQEFGDTAYTEIHCAQRFYEDVLSTCDENGINWVHYAYECGDFNYAAPKDIFKRNGAAYETMPSGRQICVDLREIFRNHMDK